MRRDFNKKRMENFVVQIPISSTEICFSHSFLMWNWRTQTVGIEIFENHWFLAFKPSVCIGFGSDPSVGLSIKVTEELDMYEGGFIARLYGLRTKKTILRETQFGIEINNVGIEISAISTARLTRTDDTWMVNPWALLPKVAVQFPVT
jgi:hypothetical protein